MNAIERAGAVLILTMLAAGCSPMTAEQRAALEERDRQLVKTCEGRGGYYINGSCISRGGGQ